MDTRHVEYIQDIAFNDICDKMAICTTSKKIIIYQKVLKKSNDLIIINDEIKEEINNKNNKPPKSGFHNTIGFLKSAEKRRKPKDRSNNNIQSKFNPNLNDSIELKAKLASSKSLISIEKQNAKKRQKSEKNDEDEEDNNDFYFLSRNSNSNLFKSINFGRKNNYKIDKNNYGINYDINNDSFDSLNNSLKHTKNKEYDYRWEKITSLNIDGPGLRLQWANSEFGNILACSGYNKCVYIIKVENLSEANWTKITEFNDIVEDISFAPRNDILELATITPEGCLKTFQFQVTIGWNSNHSLQFSKKSEYTCLCCNPSNLDKLTIVVGCKKPFTDENKNDKNNLKDERKLKASLKKQDSIKTNQSNDLLKIVYFKDNNSPLTGSINGGHEDDITDVDWANQNGRLHHMICSTSKDGIFIIWEINLLPEELSFKNDGNKINNNSFFTYKKLFEFEHKKPLWRCSFNESGILASCIDEDGENFVFLKTGRDKFVKLDINKQK